MLNHLGCLFLCLDWGYHEHPVIQYVFQNNSGDNMQNGEYPGVHLNSRYITYLLLTGICFLQLVS